jgi:predicted acylesterase/phospholipase RssA
LLAETPAGAATLLKTDLRSIIAPSFGMEFIQRLNNDEALMLNDVQNIVQRHLRESGKVPAAIPSNPDSNPVTQPDLTLANPAPVTVGHDYNRRGPISASTLTPAPVEQRTIEQHDEDLQAGAALYQGETVGQPGVASNSATGDEPTEENKEFVAP